MRNVFLLTIIMVAVGCAPKKVSYRTIQGFAQGTTYAITYKDSLRRDFRGSFDSLLDKFDRSLSNYNDSSLLTRVNNGEDLVLDDWFVECFEISAKIYHQSDSLFDPTLRPLIAAYGFGRKHNEGLLYLTDEQLDSLKKIIGLHKVKIVDKKLVRDDPRITLDFNAIAQGQSVDIISDWLAEHGVRDYLVEIGGEIIASGNGPSGGAWRIGVDKPQEGNFSPGATLETIIELQDRALATSGNYRKFIDDSVSGAKFTHTIDPRSGIPARHNLLSITILAPTAALADGYATACMVGGREWTLEFLGKHKELSAFLVYADQNGEMISEKINY